LVYKGATDCSGNPNYPAADAGHLYIVSIAGKIGGASGVAVEAGDMFLCKTDGTTAGTQAQRGTSWNAVQANLLGPIPVKASGAEINTGIDDSKYVTAKGIEDSNLARTSDIPVAGPTNSAGANVVPKSNGSNLVASRITDDGTTVKLAGTPAAGEVGTEVTSDGFVSITNGGNGMDVDFRDSINVLTVLLGDPSIGLRINGAGDKKVELRSVGVTAIGDTQGDNNFTRVEVDDPAQTITLTATNGTIMKPPTSDPHVAGAIWNNAGTLAISAG
jgi:hypothetical protein